MARLDWPSEAVQPLRELNSPFCSTLPATAVLEHTGRLATDPLLDDELLDEELLDDELLDDELELLEDELLDDELLDDELLDDELLEPPVLTTVGMNWVIWEARLVRLAAASAPLVRDRSTPQALPSQSTLGLENTGR